MAISLRQKEGEEVSDSYRRPVEQEAWEKDPWNAQPRGISFSFVQLEPKEILGTNYQDKKSNQISGASHGQR